MAPKLCFRKKFGPNTNLMSETEQAKVPDAETVMKNMKNGVIPPIKNYFNEDMIDFGDIIINETPIKKEPLSRNGLDGEGMIKIKGLAVGGPIGTEVEEFWSFGPKEEGRIMGLEPTLASQDKGYITTPGGGGDRSSSSFRVYPPAATESLGHGGQLQRRDGRR